VELRTLEIANVLGDDRRGASRDGELDDVVISFVTQIGPPSIIDVCPAADAEEGVEQRVSLAVSLASVLSGGGGGRRLSLGLRLRRRR
jgi:hypothetical protein